MLSLSIGGKRSVCIRMETVLLFFSLAKNARNHERKKYEFIIWKIFYPCYLKCKSELSHVIIFKNLILRFLYINLLWKNFK